MSSAGELQNLEWYSGVPRSIHRQTLFGLVMVVLTFGGFGTWAVTAPLSAAVIAQGSFVATGENKIVQHFEGGIVKELLVHEGDTVRAGQDLLRLDETAARVNAQQLQLRLVRLQAVWARLNGEINGLDEYEPPAEVRDDLGNPEIVAILDSQRKNFNSARDKLRNETALMQQNENALQFRIEGRKAQIVAMEQQLALLREDHDVIIDLRARGVASQSAVRTLERSIADAEGDIARLRAEVQETLAQIEKYRREMIQASDAARQAALDEMQSVEAELDALHEQTQQANTVLARTTITAPVAGTIVRMYYHTTGGVIESGKAIFEILPADVPLIVEVKIPRLQIDEVRHGQNATVRLTALNQRTTPVLDGEVIYISADTIADTADMNQEIYVARVGISPEQLARVDGFTPTPGMPAEVFVQTRQRTFLEYLLKPIADSMSRSFHER